MARRTRLVLAALVGVLIVALVAGYLAWTRWDTARAQRAQADKIAAALSAGAVSDDDFLATAGVSPSAEYAAAIRGMTGLKPQVSVTSVTEQGNAAEATLHYVWTPPGAAQPWAYDTVLPLEKTDAGWKASWSRGVVAPGLADTERLLYNRLKPTRGRVLGAGGAQIAYDQPALRVGLDKAQLAPEAVEPAARLLARTLSANGVSIDQDSFATKAAAAGSKAFVEAALLRTSDSRQQAAGDAVKGQAGVSTQQVLRSLAISPTFFRGVLGQVGEATPEIVQASGGAVRAGDFVGTGGLQKAQDAVLRGSAGYVIQAAVEQGSQARDYQRVPAVSGRDVTTTIDVDLQKVAEEVLSGVEPASAIVAIQPSTGQIRAAASGPGASGVASTATQGLYAPGSTFKTVTGLAFLRNGLTPESPLPCTPTITVGGRTFNNFTGYPASALGTQPWRTSFMHSCNTAVLSQHAQVSQQQLADAAASLGLTATPALGVSASLGKVPASLASESDHAAAMIGHSQVVATPLGMATVAASIAAGRTVTPVLIEGLAAGQPGASGTPGASVAPSGAAPSGPASDAASAGPAAGASAAPAEPLDPQHAEQLRSLMRSVVTDGGAKDVLAGVPGGPIIAKTGTGPYDEGGRTKYRTWMIAAQDDLAVAVFVADGSSGAGTSGPLLREFLTKRPR